MNIFNIFPSSVPQNTVAKILPSNCIVQSKKYVSIRSLRLNRVFTDLANSQEKHCLTIDSSNKSNLDDIEPQMTISTNRFAILISHMTINFTMFYNSTILEF